MAQELLGVQSGYATATTCKIMAASLVAGNVTIAVSGIGNFTITMTALGTDYGSKPQAGFVGSTTITGLASFTDYNYTATQGANSVTGRLCTAPSVNDDFCFWHNACYNNYSFTGDLGVGTIAGLYTHMRAYDASTGALKTVGVLHVDDHGYWDLNNVQEGGGGHGASGNNYAYTTALVYDYALGALANFGLFSATGNAYCTNPQHADIVWCKRHFNSWPQWGDHDAGADEMGFTKNPASAVGTPSPLTQFTNSRTVWNAIMGGITPPSIGVLDTGAKHWGFQCGPVYICSPDGISNGAGNAVETFPTGYSGPTTLYGNNQIDDCLNALSNNSEFKVLGMSYSIRYLSATASKNGSGAQNPLFNNNLTEYQRIFTRTGATPKSLMDNPKTNGILGSLVCLHGDYHAQLIAKHEAAAYAGNAKEWFYSINPGPVNGTINHANTQGVVTGAVVGGTTVKHFSSVASVAGAIRVEVYGSRYPKEMHYVFLGTNGETIKTEKFVANRGNTAYAISAKFNISTTPAASTD